MSSICALGLQFCKWFVELTSFLLQSGRNIDKTHYTVIRVRSIYKSRVCFIFIPKIRPNICLTRIFYGKINIWHICTVIILLEGTSSSETKENANETRENHATDVDWYYYTSLMYHAVTISQWNTTWKKNRGPVKFKSISACPNK